jgi:bacterioferritin-associated ferredoxin
METGLCPLCDREGDPVKATTVKALSKTKDDISDQTFRICLNPNCKVVYYSPENTFTTDYVHVPIWYKRDAHPKYICYCANITEQQIIDAIEKGAGSLREVIKITGAMQNCDCERKNPTGQCCAPQIQELLKR